MAREYIELVEDFLGAPSDERIEIYLYADSPPQCALVCYTPEGYIAANWNALDHEVVHAVVARFAPTTTPEDPELVAAVERALG